MTFWVFIATSLDDAVLNSLVEKAVIFDSSVDQGVNFAIDSQRRCSCSGTFAGVPFTPQGSQVRTLYHPPVIRQLNQALTRNRGAFFTSKSGMNTPYQGSYISELVLLGIRNAVAWDFQAKRA